MTIPQLIGYDIGSDDHSVEVYGHYDKHGNVVIDSIERLAITKEIEQRRARIARRLER